MGTYASVVEVSDSIPGSYKCLYDLQRFVPKFGYFLYIICMYLKKIYKYSISHLSLDSTSSAKFEARWRGMSAV